MITALQQMWIIYYFIIISIQIGLCHGGCLDCLCKGINNRIRRSRNNSQNNSNPLPFYHINPLKWSRNKLVIPLLGDDANYTETVLFSPLSNWTISNQEAQHNDYVLGLMYFQTPKAQSHRLLTFDPLSIPSENTDTQMMKGYKRKINYLWENKEFATLNLTQNINIRVTMLISVQLNYASMFVQHIGYGLRFLKKHPQLTKLSHVNTSFEDMVFMHKEIKMLIEEIPYSHYNNESGSIKAKSTVIYSNYIPKMIDYISKVSEALSMLNIRYTGTSFYKKDRLLQKCMPSYNNGIDMQRPEMEYNVMFEKHNYSENELPDDGRQQRERNFNIQYLNPKTIWDFLARHLILTHDIFKTINDLMECNNVNEIKFVKHQPSMKFVVARLPQTMEAVFPDIEYTLTSAFYKHEKVSKAWLPVTIIRYLISKIIMHSRRMFWGHYMLLRLKIGLSHEIKHNKVYLRYSFTDNCPPMQVNTINKLQNKIIIDYDEMIENKMDNDTMRIDCNGQWLCNDNIYLLSTMLMSEINGNFGIINHYNGSGFIRNVLFETKTLYLDFPLDGCNITQEDIHQMIQNGKIYTKQTKKEIVLGQN